MSGPSDNSATSTCWVVSDGRRGIENQALGLAEAVAGRLGAPLGIERIIVRKDGFVTLPAASRPDLWIGCGRAAIPLAREHRGIFPGCFFVYVQDPRGHYGDFDLIAAPRHDRLDRPNALSMIGSPNRVTADQLAAGANDFRDQIEALPGPRAAILIGGHSKRFKLTPRIAGYLEDRMQGWLDQDVSLMVTVSRRTPAAIRARLEARFAGHDRVWFFNGEGANPYFAFLAAADWIFVTEESTNMLVEACVTGRPVYALPMDGSPGKFSRLHAELEGIGAVRPYLGEIERWAYQPLHETDRIAQALIASWRHVSTEHSAGEAA